jgi:exodeoxyribonuclease V
MILNESQQRTVEDGVSWFYHSSDQVFEIDGEAGTGKSIVLSEIVRRLNLRPYEYMAMAYTGQAAIIMRLKGFPTAKSIHSSLYELVKKPKMYQNNPFRKINTELNTPEYDYEFVPISIGSISPEVKLFIIDEGYMVPDYMRQTILKHHIKVLVAGDAGQLPPIGGEPAFLTGYGVHHLTEIMRQSLNNPIVYIAHRARRGLPIHCGQYNNNVLVIEDTDLNDSMIVNVGNIVCGTNKTRDYFNKRTRDILGIQTPYPLYGERVICRNNNWNVEQDGIALANGLAGIVASPYSVNSFDKKTFTINFLPDLLNSPFVNIKIDYEYLISPYDIRAQIKKSPYQSEGEKFEYAYALTTHLSQGAEFPCGIYYEEFLRSNIQNQLNYTGITRFKEYMIYVKKTRKYY